MCKSGACAPGDFAYRMYNYCQADGVIFSYFLSTTIRDFDSAVPLVTDQDSPGWTANITSVPPRPANNGDVRAINLAEDIAMLLAGE